MDQHFKENWLQMEKMKSVPNCPKWRENLTTKFFGIVDPPLHTPIVAAPQNLALNEKYKNGEKIGLKIFWNF